MSLQNGAGKRCLEMGSGGISELVEEIFILEVPVFLFVYSSPFYIPVLSAPFMY